MKATGIVRRIDDLGRVVIPKEIRRTLRIREGDPLEIFTEKDGSVNLPSRCATPFSVPWGAAPWSPIGIRWWPRRVLAAKKCRKAGSPRSCVR